MIGHSPPASRPITPTIDSDSSSSSRIKNRKRKQPDNCHLNDTLQTFAESLKIMNSTLLDMRNEMTKLAENSSEIRNDLNALRISQTQSEGRIVQIENTQGQLANYVEELKNSTEFAAAKYHELETQFSKLERRVATSTNADEATIQLENRMDILEQNARACNIEISNVPEKRGENLLHIVESLGSIIKFAINRRDIVAIHRVAQMNDSVNRPKNIIVRFPSVPCRDNILSAFRKAKGVTSAQLGIPGSPSTIYVNEHLTLKKKLLFRECRKEAQKHSYRFVWIKHATILARKSETSAVVAIRFPKDLEKLAVDSHTTSTTSLPL